MALCLLTNTIIKMTIQIGNRQSLVDVALENLGSVEAVFSIFDALGSAGKGLALTDNFQGAELMVDDAAILDINIVNIYRKNNIIPTSL